MGDRVHAPVITSSRRRSRVSHPERDEFLRRSARSYTPRRRYRRPLDNSHRPRSGIRPARGLRTRRASRRFVHRGATDHKRASHAACAPRATVESPRPSAARSTRGNTTHGHERTGRTDAVGTHMGARRARELRPLHSRTLPRTRFALRARCSAPTKRCPHQLFERLGLLVDRGFDCVFRFALREPEAGEGEHRIAFDLV